MHKIPKIIGEIVMLMATHISAPNKVTIINATANKTNIIKLFNFVTSAI